MRVKLAEQDEVEQYEKDINLVLKVIGFPDALVTDESWIGDFILGDLIPSDILSTRGKRMVTAAAGTRQRDLALMSKKFGFELKLNDRIVDVAIKVSKLPKYKRFWLYVLSIKSLLLQDK